MSKCPTCTKEYSNLSAHLNRHYPEHKPESWPTCLDCGERYKNIGLHWTNSNCSHQGLSQTQKEIVTGILMGDGHISRYGKNPYLNVGMIKQEYIKYVANFFPWLHPNIMEKDDDIYDDEFYVLETRSSYVFKPFAEWYSTGEKVFPEDIDLTPTVLKHWYVGDGHLNQPGYPTIGVSNEIENKKKLEKMFERVGISIRWKPKELVVCADDVDYFFDYVGDPLPGFEYKWP